MQAVYPLAFVREMGCTDAELRAWLPGAGGGRRIAWREQGADIELGGGSVSIGWRTREPRRIAQIAVPCLEVHFEALGVDAAAWQQFMRHFDLYTQRGGG
jgi:hypothetical protein